MAEYIKVKVNNDAQAAIASGSKGELLDFSDTLAFIPEIKQETFVEALKLLPPQILLELEDTLDYLSLKNSNKKEVPNKASLVLLLQRMK